MAAIGVAGSMLALVLAHIRTPPALELRAAQEAESDTTWFSPDTLVGWDRGPRQPILFSHRRHAGVFEIDCFYCHSNTDRSPYAYVPSVTTCMGCHRVVKSSSPAIQALSGYLQREEPIEWVRIYRVPDFVQFNHARHVVAGVECTECHGPVDSMDVVYQVAPLTMGWCLDCHWQPASPEKLAEARRLARRYAVPGREERGLYPAAIDQAYGETRAPIDCATCHY